MEQVEENRDIDKNHDEIDPADNPPAEDEANDADENIIKRDIKRMFRRTTSDARRMFLRVRRSFVDFFNR